MENTRQNTSNLTHGEWVEWDNRETNMDDSIPNNQQRQKSNNLINFYLILLTYMHLDTHT